MWKCAGVLIGEKAFFDRREMLKAYVWNTAFYRSKSRIINTQKKWFEAFEIWCYRKLPVIYEINSILEQNGVGMGLLHPIGTASCIKKILQKNFGPLVGNEEIEPALLHL